MNDTPGGVVAVAGLPGVGKSTVARALADRVAGVVLDKDQVRAAVFPPSRVEYSSAQNDFCMDLLYRTAGWLAHREPTLTVIIDGCTYTRAEQVTALRRFTARLGAPWWIVECVCPEHLALTRLEQDRRRGCHLAADRGPELYRALRAAADPIPEPKLVVDTGTCLGTVVAHCVRYLARA